MNFKLGFDFAIDIPVVFKTRDREKRLEDRTGQDRIGLGRPWSRTLAGPGFEFLFKFKGRI